jgi:hypothetical protein
MSLTLKYWGFVLSIPLFSLLLEAQTLWAQARTQKEMEEIRLKRIKFKRVYAYEFIDGQEVKEGYMMHLISYEPGGKTLEMKEYNSSGALAFIHKFEYIPKTTLLSKEIILRRGEAPRQILEYEYDAKKNITQIKTLDSSQTHIKTIFFEYDKNNNLIKKQERDLQGKTLQTWKYIYKNNNIDTIKLYKDNNQLYMMWVYEYNLKKQLRKLYTLNPDGSLFSLSTFTYDMKDNVMEERREDASNNPLMVLRYRYEYYDGRN